MSENPYAPPATDSEVPDAPPDHGWQVSGNYLLLSPRALLPMVDPYNGQTADRMTLREVTIRHRPFSNLFLLLFGVALVLATTFVDSDGLNPALGISGAVICLAAFIGSLMAKSATFQVFSTRSTNLRIQTGTWIGCLTIFSVVAMIGSGTFARTYPWISATFLTLFLILLAIRIIAPCVLRGFTCRRKTGNHFEIRGIHPDALEHLRLIEIKRSNSARSAAPSHISGS